MTKKYIIGSSFAVMAFVLSVGSVSAFSMMPARGVGRMGNTTRINLGVVGKVTAIHGTNITILSRGPANSQVTSTPTMSITVDASNAVVIKNSATSTVSSIAVNDVIQVAGSLSGSSIVATKIYDGKINGIMNSRGEIETGIRNKMMSSSTTQFKLRGEDQVEASNTEATTTKIHMGMMSSIGNFFRNMFRF